MKFKLEIAKYQIDLDFDKPISVSREVKLIPKLEKSQAFHLPNVVTETFRYQDKFVGDVTKGGSCNVLSISYCPHNITHIETSAHILVENENSITIDKIPENRFQGLVYLIDLSNLPDMKNFLITKEILANNLKNIDLPISMIAIKTVSSNYDVFYDFSDKEFMAFSKDAAEYLSKFQEGTITSLILDLPSLDLERDEGKLLAHRAFFEIPEGVINYEDKKKRVVIELAHFANLEQGFYYCITTPAKIQTNAVTTGIKFYKVVNYKKLD
jgi:arylformamidase